MQDSEGKLGMTGFKYGKGKDSFKKIAARFGGAGTMALHKKSKHYLNLKSKSNALDKMKTK